MKPNAAKAVSVAPANIKHMSVRPKKHLGQHFLRDRNIARKIAGALDCSLCRHVLEIGPGTGILTEFLLEKCPEKLQTVEIDREAAAYLKRRFGDKIFIYETDFLKMDLSRLYPEGGLCIIGNFPYNISSQIFFKILENHTLIPQVVGMIQKEVAERISAIHGNKRYGILSVLLQIFYQVEKLFDVPPGVFSPPPKVQSSVVRLTHRRDFPRMNEELFRHLVKTAFNQRRKTLRNSLKKLNLPPQNTWKEFEGLRPEQLSPADFVQLYRIIYNQ